MPQKLKKMEANKKIAIYPGTFDPFTIGHLNVTEKAEELFGKENVIIAVGTNPQKEKNPDAAIFRAQTIKGNLPSRNIESYKGFLTNYVWEKEKQGFDVTIIRGLRQGFDLHYEMTLLRAMQDFKPDIKVVYFVCDKEFDHVSSSLYRLCEIDEPGSGHRYLAKEYPTTKQVSENICVVFVDSTKELLNEKYVIVSKSKMNDVDSELKVHTLSKYNFEGSYVQCLEWIKFTETAK